MSANPEASEKAMAKRDGATRASILPGSKLNRLTDFGTITDIRRDRSNVAPRRQAVVADRVRGRDRWAESALTRVAPGRTGVQAKAEIGFTAHNRVTPFSHIRQTNRFEAARTNRAAS